EMATATVLPVHIFEGQDFYVPAFLIKVQNQALRRDVLNDVMSITYSDSLANVHSFYMMDNTWHAGAQVFDQTASTYSRRDTFNPWKDVEVWMGYYRNGKDERRRMLTGEITTLTPNFPQSGSPTLTVRGLNLLHRFRTKQETRPFFAKKDTEIAQVLVNDIAEEIRKKSPQLKLKLDPQDVANNLRREEPIPYLVMD